METSPCHNSVAGHKIATNFCICHDSTAVVPCTKFCSDHCIRIEVRVKRNFHRIWIAMEKPLLERAPGMMASLYQNAFQLVSAAVVLTTKLETTSFINQMYLRSWGKECPHSVWKRSVKTLSLRTSTAIADAQLPEPRVMTTPQSL